MKQKDEVAKMKEINYKAISNKIRRKRVSMGLTQEYLATAADVNVSHISNIENCHSKVSLNTLVYICKAMNTTLDYVVSEEYSSDNESLDQQIILELKKCDTVLKEKNTQNNKRPAIIVNLSYKYNKVSFRFMYSPRASLQTIGNFSKFCEYKAVIRIPLRFILISR